MGLFKPGLPLLRRVAGALLARGNYVPAETRTNARGETIIVTEEVVERKGILGSRTVWMAGFARGCEWQGQLSGRDICRCLGAAEDA